MRWEDEPYVRLYTRDTADWACWSWDAQCLFMQLLRVVDRAGILALGRHGKRAVAVAVRRVDLWESRIAPALEELISDGCLEIRGDLLVMPNYRAAQEAKTSDRERKRKSRETALASARSVTSGHTPSQDVTLIQSSTLRCDALPSSAVHTLLPSEVGVAPAQTPPKIRKLSGEQAFHSWAMEQRLRIHPGIEDDETIGGKTINVMAKPILDKIGRVGGQRAYAAYLADEQYRSKTPPWPFRLFCFGGVWQRLANTAATSEWRPTPIEEIKRANSTNTEGAGQ